MKRLRDLVLLLVLVCAVGAASRTDASGGRSPLVVARNHTHAFHLFAPVVALKKGYFQNVGVQISDRNLEPEFLDGDALARAMDANGIDIVVDVRTRAIFKQTRPRLCVVGGWQEGTLDDVAVISRDEIRSVKDLDGKRCSRKASTRRRASCG